MPVSCVSIGGGAGGGGIADVVSGTVFCARGSPLELLLDVKSRPSGLGLCDLAAWSAVGFRDGVGRGEAGLGD